MNFKDIIQNDTKTFLNPKEFGDKHIVEGKEMTIIIDENELTEREKHYKMQDEGLMKRQILFYVSKVEFGELPKQGTILSLDREVYTVSNAICEGGIYSIELEANISRGYRGSR
jgi:hypothetical protein